MIISRVQLFLLSAMIILALATVAAMGSRHHWVLELFSHFRLHYLVAQTALILLLLVCRAWPWAALAILTAVPNLLIAGPYLPGLLRAPAAMPPGDARPHTLVAVNLLHNQKKTGAMQAYLQERLPDVLVLSEFTPRWAEVLADLGQRYPHSILQPRPDAWGMALYSRYPLAEQELLNLGDDRTRHFRVRLLLPGGSVELYAVHLASPISGRRAGERDRQLEVLAGRVAAGDPEVPKIVAGDLNLTPYSPYFDRFLRAAGLEDARRALGHHGTWPAALGAAGIQIDHCLVSPGVRVASVRAGRRAGSDHRPLECDIVPGS